jgi:hypothetical protein
MPFGKRVKKSRSEGSLKKGNGGAKYNAYFEKANEKVAILTYCFFATT